jgi:hypothetical protein
MLPELERRESMAEANLNAEMARHLDEHGGRGRSPHERAIEIAEAVLLAVVAVLTAWSGYQAALWDGESARAYATSARERIEAEQAYLRSGQTLAYNAGTFNAWLQATVQGQEDLATVLDGRFTPEYKGAFDAWLELDPLNDPDAPAGPALMPGYEDPELEQSAELSEQATESFEEAVHSRETADNFVRATVVLAGVLFLIAVGQRFDIKGVRIGVLAVAGAFLVYGIVLLASLEIA